MDLNEYHTPTLEEIRYYEDKAHQLRAEYMRDWVHGIANSIRNLFSHGKSAKAAS